jgi:hypothetical protein
LKRSLGTKSIKKVNRILITDKKEVLAIVVGLALALSTFSSSPSSFNNYFLQPAEAGSITDKIGFPLLPDIAKPELINTTSNHVTRSVDVSSSPSSSSSSSSSFPSIRSKIDVSSSSSIQPKVPQAVLLYTGQKYAMSPYISSNYGERTINKIGFPLLPDIAKPELILQTGKIISFEFSKTPKGMEAFAIDYDGDINSIYALKKTGVNTFELTGVSSVRNLEVHVLFSDGQYVSYNKLVDIRDGSSSTVANTAGKDNNADYRYSNTAGKDNNADYRYSSSSLPCSGQAKLKVAAVTASGQDTINNRATNVLDDNVDTIWSSKTKGDWIQLDLGEERSICNIGISFQRGDQSINFFSIQTSADGAHFSPHGSGQNTGMVSGGELYGYADLPTTARFVRITNLGNMPAQEFGLAEVAVLGK